MSYRDALLNKFLTRHSANLLMRGVHDLDVVARWRLTDQRIREMDALYKRIYAEILLDRFLDLRIEIISYIRKLFYTKDDELLQVEEETMVIVASQLSDSPHLFLELLPLFPTACKQEKEFVSLRFRAMAAISSQLPRSVRSEAAEGGAFRDTVAFMRFITMYTQRLRKNERDEEFIEVEGL